MISSVNGRKRAVGSGRALAAIDSSILAFTLLISAFSCAAQAGISSCGGFSALELCTDSEYPEMAIVFVNVRVNNVRATNLYIIIDFCKWL